MFSKKTLIKRVRSRELIEHPRKLKLSAVYNYKEHFLCYGLETDGTCSEDETRYGFTLVPVGGWLPYDEKVIPDYILSFTETEMIFEAPSDDEYFLYQSSYFDGI